MTLPPLVPVIGVNGPLPARKIIKKSNPMELERQLLRLRAREISHIRLLVNDRPMDYKSIQVRVGQMARSLGLKVSTYMDEKRDLIVCRREDTRSVKQGEQL